MHSLSAILRAQYENFTSHHVKALLAIHNLPHAKCFHPTSHQHPRSTPIIQAQQSVPSTSRTSIEPRIAAMSEQLSLNQADAVMATATMERPASESLHFVTHEANAYTDIIARMERTEAALRAQLQVRDATIDALSKENETPRAQIASQSHGGVESNGDGDVKMEISRHVKVDSTGEAKAHDMNAWYVSNCYLPLTSLELLLLAKEHGKADDGAIDEQTSDDTHCHGGDGDLIAMGQDNRES